MIALMNQTPSYCPKCGYLLAKCFRDPLSREDFFAGAASTCPTCGLHFAYLNGPALLAATEEHGDMTRYVTPADVA